MNVGMPILLWLYDRLGKKKKKSRDYFDSSFLFKLLNDTPDCVYLLSEKLHFKINDYKTKDNSLFFAQNIRSNYRIDFPANMLLLINGNFAYSDIFNWNILMIL